MDHGRTSGGNRLQNKNIKTRTKKVLIKEPNKRDILLGKHKEGTSLLLLLVLLNLRISYAHQHVNVGICFTGN